MQQSKSHFYLTALVLISIISLTCSVNAEPFEGYTLFNPTNSRTTSLINMDGRSEHTWNNARGGGYSVYLLENGHILRPAQVNNPQLRGGAYAGLVQEINWEGDVVWEFEYSSATYITHHDIERLPNGNILLIAWEVKSVAEARQAGLNRNASLWPDHIIEVDPSGDHIRDIIWEWHAWDHLIQDFDRNRDNYGVVADHPELLNINMAGRGGPGPGGGDWLHINGISHNPVLDQIVISSHHADEIYVIDHSTTIEEAASHEGGNSGMGGDILYRWGNPGNYDADGEQVFEVVHCSWWIPYDLPGGGNLMAFNNGERDRQSVIIEIVPPVDDEGNYELEEGQAFGPEEPVWTYSDGRNFYSNHLGSCQRLPNGNTLISESTSGHLLEVDIDGNIEWEYNLNRGQIARSLRYAMDYPGLYPLHPVDEGDLVINEFLVDNDTTEADQNGEFDGWIEIYNNTDEELSVWGFFLSDDSDEPTKWTFPDTSIDAHDFLIVWADNDEQEGLHTNFELSTEGGELLFHAPDQTELDAIEYGEQTTDRSIGRFPNGTGDFIEMTPSFGLENVEDEVEVPDYSGLVINEILILNDITQADQDNEYDSWIELFNNSDESISLARVSFCIETIMPEENWPFPDTSIAAHGYLIIWADGDVEQEGLHTDFSLSGFDGELLLFDYGNVDIDRAEWYEQTADISLGRYPNGIGEFIEMTPSFAAENLDGIQTVPEIDNNLPGRFALLQNYPNPFNSFTTVSFQLASKYEVMLMIYNTLGARIATLVNKPLPAGHHEIVWDGTNVSDNSVSTGIYFYVLQADGYMETHKIVLMR